MAVRHLIGACANLAVELLAAVLYAIIMAFIFPLYALAQAIDTVMAGRTVVDLNGNGLWHNTFLLVLGSCEWWLFLMGLRWVFTHG